jgi:hypothetical protein
MKNNFIIIALLFIGLAVNAQTLALKPHRKSALA